MITQRRPFDIVSALQRVTRALLGERPRKILLVEVERRVFGGPVKPAVFFFASEPVAILKNQCRSGLRNSRLPARPLLT